MHYYFMFTEADRMYGDPACDVNRAPNTRELRDVLEIGTRGQG